jgi:sugar O-acyltransferase (sialic acid O-acetyltransferase NeuD family)
MKLFVYCAGGFGREVYDCARRQNAERKCWDAIHFIDDAPGMSADYYGTKLYSLDAVLSKFKKDDIEISIGNGEPAIRRTLYDKVKGHGLRLATVVDPSAIIIDTAKVGEGVIVTSNCLIASLAEVGNNVALNVQAIIGHDVKLGDHTVVSSMVNVGGAVVVGESSFFGMGVQIKQGLTIGRDVIVGMGSVVYDSIADEIIALGNPARPMKKNTAKLVFAKPL